MKPTVRKVDWKACSTAPGTSGPPYAWLHSESTAPATATPRLMASICTIDSRPLPLLALAPSRSLRVMVFIAENCRELTAPKAASCSTCHASGQPGSRSAKLAISIPSMAVLATRTLR